jgi:cation transport ATPase
MAYQVTSELRSTVTLKVSGLRCQSCVQKVEAALSSLSGVTDAKVNFAEQKAYINYDAALINTNELTAVIETQGYRALESEANDKESQPNYSGRTLTWFPIPRPYIFGTIASIAIVGIYLGMNTLTADWYYAKVQFNEYRWWIVALAFGLGVQVTLFSLLRAQLKKNRMRAAKSSMAASGGVSATAMMACCSHYLATVLPALSLPFLSAAAVAKLEQYQPYFFLAGILSCVVGIGLMVRMMKKNGMIPTGTVKRSFNFGFGRLVDTGGTRSDNVKVF